MTRAATRSETTRLVKERALDAGFDLVRITTAEDFLEDREVALKRIDEGLMDGLPWYKPSRVMRGTSPNQLLPNARSIICLALNYFPGESSAGESVQADDGQPGVSGPYRGKIARYAWGRDYHRVMKRKMRELVADLSALLELEVSARWYVDDGPMLDRAAAARAGLGWFGKNSNILTSELGSWVFLGQVITDLELEPDPPIKKSCGSCVRCIDACPTGAIVAPYVVDNTRCISYQTIENRGAIPLELRPQMLDWVFGCDICQEVCPVNRKETPTREPAFGQPDLSVADLVEILEMSEDRFLERFAGTPIMRAKRVGLQRNACVALGNLNAGEAVTALGRALLEGDQLVRSHAAWALGEIGGSVAASTLKEAASTETNDEVLSEIRAAVKASRLHANRKETGELP